MGKITVTGETSHKEGKDGLQLEVEIINLSSKDILRFLGETVSTLADDMLKDPSDKAARAAFITSVMNYALNAPKLSKTNKRERIQFPGSGFWERR